MKRLATLAWLLIAADLVFADELKLDAKALFERSTTQNVRLSADGQSIELDEGELIEDDGPAAGFSYKPNEEKLSDTVWIKKELIVENPVARKATLLVAQGGKLSAIINGKPIDLPDPTKVGGYWQAYAIPPDCLKAGKNEIVLHGAGKTWIARAEDFPAGSTERSEHPGRSFRSIDGGRTWNHDKLGSDGSIRGEYGVRLSLDRFHAEGSVTLPVIDSANLAGESVGDPLVGMPVVIAEVNAKASPQTEVVLYSRSGNSPVPDKAWTSWKKIVKRQEPLNSARYLQTEIRLVTKQRSLSPLVTSVRFEAILKTARGGISLPKMLQQQNATIVRPSITFQFEPFDHPTLKKLRADYNLDALTKDAKTELELIEKLAVWTANTLQGGHLKEIYPAWNAFEILKPHADGKPIGGFCQQYNLVFLQACESFGIPGRAVSIGQGDHFTAIKGSGHEVVELWSNQFKKWIYVDGNLAWYAVDSKTKTPLSLLELRERQRKAVKKEDGPATETVELAPGKHRWTSLTEWPVFQELRLIPRSNFLEQKAPLPLNQGMRGWFWTGHHVWSDKEAPASIIYSNRVTDRKNWEWTLNQAHFTLESMPTEGELKVHLDTETPGFETFLASIDGEKAKPVESGFAWKLKKGKNRLEVWPRNIAGREGIKSHVVIEMP